ncbi:hypothetical protein [Variovorax sp. KK3]|uniref:hypothetical protein n=1 Tax=Variovorax sp. KK3 TaxID=1855728 RepID=UPI001C4E0165|nr:hypothetical protein [Variovorax sp. KK3]
MDFVASREDEMKNGWRNRIGEFLRDMGCVVFDPWQKPEVRGLMEYGREGTDTARIRERWTFEDNAAGAKRRAGITGKFWETLHIDLRMVDTTDFTIAYCPTNIYSVGTPHEIALCRQQRKPVLFVSPPVEFPALDALRVHLANDATGKQLLDELERQVPIKANPAGVPSLWYMPLVGGESFFDGFGFDHGRRKFKWSKGPLDEREQRHKPARPLLPFLSSLAHELPKKWDNKLNRYVRNDDWLLWKLHREEQGAEIAGPHEA